MSDDRFVKDPDDEANANGARPYLDVPKPGVRPFFKQADRRGPPTPEEIQKFIAEQFPETQKTKKVLVRPPGWDEEKPRAPDEAEEFER